MWANQFFCIFFRVKCQINFLILYIFTKLIFEIEVWVEECLGQLKWALPLASCFTKVKIYWINWPSNNYFRMNACTFSLEYLKFSHFHEFFQNTNSAYDHKSNKRSPKLSSLKRTWFHKAVLMSDYKKYGLNLVLVTTGMIGNQLYLFWGLK